MKIRRTRLTRRALFGTVVLCLMGLPMALFGIEMNGFPGPLSVLPWAITVLAVAGLFYVTLALHATFEKEEDDEQGA